MRSKAGSVFPKNRVYRGPKGMMSDTGSEVPNWIDRSVKALFRECPAAALRLASMEVAPEAIRIEDPNLNLPELRAAS